MTDTILDVRNLQVQFQIDDRISNAVDNISFVVKRGQTLGIVGESGSGKSVTALAVMGLIPCPPGKVAGGEIWFRAQDATSQNATSQNAPVDLLTVSQAQMQQYRGDRISMIFQEPMSSLNPVYTCGYQLIEAIRLHQEIPMPEARRQAMSLLQEVKLLPSDEQMEQECLNDLQKDGKPSERDVMQEVNQRKQAILERYPHELSGGQIQRVMIAMAISCNPTLLIADEPTTALDVTVQATILDLLRELRDRRGMSIMFITHDLGIIAEIADTVAVMYQGKIVESGDILDIFAAPQHPYTKGLLACRPRPQQRMRYLPTVSDFMEVKTEGNATVIQSKVMTAEQRTHFTAEVTAEETSQRLTALEKKTPLLLVDSLQVGFPIRSALGQTKRYVMAVNNVSFQVYPGETLGLVGESGCGKTTLSRTLLQLIKSMSGKMVFEGKDITQLNSHDLRQLRRDMQIIFQDPFSSLDPRTSIGNAVMEPLNIHQVESRRDRQQRVSYLLDRVGLDPAWGKRYPHEFSGGQRQRVCIARALALNPKFIICDESVSALDVSVQAQVLNLLKELQDEFKLTYIFISHDLSVVKFMSDRIMVMNRGKIEELGPADRVYNQPQEAYTRQLIAAIPTGNLQSIRDRRSQRASS